VSPSVTQVISIFSDFSRVHPDVLEMACERGHEVHRLCIGHAKDLWVGEIFPKFLGYYNSFTRWFDEYVEKVWLAEERLYHPLYDYHGEPDLVLTIRGDELPSLWDVKSPRLTSKTWRVQTSAYKHLVEAAKGIEIGRTGCIRLSPEGKPPILDESTDTLAHDFNVFRAALICWRFFYA
jgi:hypothetical protein